MNAGIHAQPLVSIMTPAYNAGRYLGAALESALAQTYAHWELVVVDDGSSDDTRAVAERWGDGRIRVVSQANAGEAAARNTALKELRGELLAFLDADDRFLPEHLALAVAYLQAHPEMDGVYTDGYHIDPQGRRLQSLSSRRRGPFSGDLFEQLVRASDVFGPPLCVVLRRGKLQALNLSFDPQIVIGPDWDFFTRLSQAARFGYLPDLTCEYRIHQTNISVQAGLERRRASLARCREKAIELERFNACSAETRTAVFYDLLVELLVGQPERQAQALRRPQFTALPPAAQARLLRLIAAEAALQGVSSDWTSAWLEQAARQQPGQLAGQALLALQRLSPGLLRAVLRLRRGRRPPPADSAPFADIGLE